MRVKIFLNYIYWKNLNFSMWKYKILKKLNPNKKKRIIKISKIYTRKNFLNKSMQEKAYMFDGDNCPSCHGLNELNCMIITRDCYNCWKEAIKNIKFEGDDIN